MIEIRKVADCNVPSILAQVPQGAGLTVIEFIRCSPWCWAGFVDDQYACLWGLIPPTLLSSSAYLWLMVNELVDEHKFTFIRRSQIEMQNMLCMYPVITGHCLRDNVRAMQWLRWLGAKFDPDDGRIVRFTITRHEDGRSGNH